MTRDAQRSEDIRRRFEAAVPRGVAQMTPVVVESGEASTVTDVDGRSYIDFAGGIGTLNVGHRHPRVMDRVREQVEKLHHTAIGVGLTPSYVEVAERLCAVAPGNGPTKAMLVNSGAEAVENAVKIARAATGRSGLIAFDHGFHGRTLLTMSLSAKQRPNKIGFGPFVPVHRLPYPNPYRPGERWQDALRGLFERETDPSEVAAVIVEPVAGEGGFIVPPSDFLPELREACDRYGILLIVDEIQTGFGRTGHLFACEQSGVVPDLLCAGKSLAAGFPLAAVVGRAEVMDGPLPGTLGGTYTGNPISCAAALGVFEVFEEEDLLAHARRLGSVLGERLSAWRDRYEPIGHVRSLGAMAALEIVTDRETKEPSQEETKAILDYCHRQGLLLIKSGMYDNVVRMLMPLNIPDDQLAEGLRILEDGLGYVSELRTAQAAV
jgi:4-aminobutyrate aminotransferase / (S)-3-amino-2-methylpropionate transaminase / 5-aminovalerate transaminase